MSQAKVLTEKEVRKVLLYLATKKHAIRNRAMFVVLNYTGMRVGELAALRLCDVLTKDGGIREEIYLSSSQTKGKKGRTVVLSDKAQDEIKAYLQFRFKLKDLLAVTFTDTSRALFISQKDCHRDFLLQLSVSTFTICIRALESQVAALIHQGVASLRIWLTRAYQHEY